MVDLGGFLLFQGVGSGNRDQLHHFHDPDRGFLHFLTEIGVVLLDPAFEGNHQKDSNRDRSQEEQEDRQAFKDDNAKGHNNIKQNAEYADKDLRGQGFDLLHVTHDLGLKTAGLHFIMVGNRKLLQLPDQRASQLLFYAPDSFGI